MYADGVLRRNHADIREMQVSGMHDKSPPRGIVPYYIAIPQRIRELASAIERNADNATEQYIYDWIHEIMLLRVVMHCMKRTEWRDLEHGTDG